MDAVKKTDDDVLYEIRQRFQKAYDAADENYDEAIHDLEFLNGDQWPQSVKMDRSADGRPCLVINKLPTFCDQTIGDIRQNEPSIKVKPVDSDADPKTAEILTGLIRNIEVQSNAEIAYDTAAESAVRCGIGAFRIVTEYSHDGDIDDDTQSLFEQDIRVKRIKNPFTVYWDPSAVEWDKSDAEYCFITEKIKKEDFERLYPKASLQSTEGGRDKDFAWGDEASIRVVEYFFKEHEKKKIYLVRGENGIQVILKSRPDPNLDWEVLGEREVDTYKLKWCKATKADILEPVQDWPGKFIPICMVYGKEINIENKTYYHGIIRHAKDAQRLYNYSRSTSAEVISLAPKSPYLVTATMISNYQKIWDASNKKSFPYLPYNVDPLNAQAIPKRAEPISVNTGIQAEILTADQEIHDTTGLQLSSLGKKSNEKSGKAILARQREGDVAQFPYYDNLGRAIKYAGKIIVDLIPKIYDTARIVRVIGEGGKDEFVQINRPFQDEKGIEQIYDLRVGKYDVVVSVGPSYTTQREEAAESILEFMRIYPPAAPLLGDMLAKNLDWPMAQEIEKRLKMLLPPQLQSPEDQQNAPPQGGNGGMDMLTMRNMAADLQAKDLDNEKRFEEIKQLKMGGGKNAV